MYDNLKEDLEYIVDCDKLDQEIRSRAKLYLNELPSTEGLLDFFREIVDVCSEWDSCERDYELDEILPNAIRNLISPEELKNANYNLAAAVKAFTAALSEAESIAIKYGLSFSIDPSYGMGGTFNCGFWDASSQSC